MNHVSRRNLIALCIVFLAFVLRIYRIDAVPLRGDEAFALSVWTQRLSTVLSDLAPTEPQPPLVFASLRWWVLFTGKSSFAGRYYSLVWSVLTIPPLYRLGRRVANEQTGLLAALLWATSPFQVWHAQDIRNYTLWAAWSVLGTWLMLVSIEARSTRRRIAYTLATAIAAYSFYFEGLLIATHNAYALWKLRDRRPLLLRWLLTQAALAALLAPWYLQVPRLSSAGYRGTGQQLTTILQVVQAIPDTLRELLFGTTLPQTALLQSTATILALASLAGGLAWLMVTKPAKTRFLAFYLTLPLLLFLFLSTRGRFYWPRYLNGATAAYELALAGIVISLARSRLRPSRLLAAIVLSALLAISSVGLFNYFYNPATQKAPNWPALAESLNQNVRPQDMIIRNAPDPAFDYYYDRPVPQITLPDNVGMPVKEIESKMEQLLAETPRIWFVPINHPYWDPHNAVETYLEETSQLVVDTRIGDLRMQRWSPWTVNEIEIIHPTSWQIGEVVALRGFDTAPITNGDTITLDSGSTLTLIIYWEPLATTSTSYTVFTHLIGPPTPDGSTQWAGHDHPPQNGRVSTSTWETGTLLRDTFTIEIPEDAPSGEYKVTIGMYDPQTGTRLTARESHHDTQATDSIPLLSVIVP